MQIIVLDCPSCHAKLSVNDALTHATCNYCGHTFLTDSGESRKATAGESKWQAVDRLGEKVSALIEPMRKLDELLARDRALLMRIERYERILQESYTTSYVFLGILLPCFVMLITIIIAFTSIGTFMRTFIGVGASLSLYGLARLIRSKRLARSKNAVAVYREEREKNFKRISKMFKQYEFDLLPAEYRDEAAARYISIALRSHQAETIYEAAAMYERTNPTIYTARSEQQHKTKRAKQPSDGRSAFMTGLGIVAGLALIKRITKR